MSESLTPEEQRYFDTRGEASPEPTPPVPPPVQVVDRRELEQERAATHALEQRLAGLHQQLQQIEARTRPPEPTLPEFGVDPEGYIKAQIGATQKEIGELRQFRDQMAAQQQVAALVHHMTAAESEFVKSKPDYGQAAQHLLTTRAGELKELGYNDQQAAHVLQQEALTLAATAARSGKNFAETVYSLARSRGFSPSQAQAAAQQAPPGADQLTATDLAALSRTPRSTAAPPRVTAAQLGEMSPKQFAKFAAEHPDEFRRLMGG